MISVIGDAVLMDLSNSQALLGAYDAAQGAEQRGSFFIQDGRVEGSFLQGDESYSMGQTAGNNTGSNIGSAALTLGSPHAGSASNQASAHNTPVTVPEQRPPSATMENH
jgi:hypothetical protein